MPFPPRKPSQKKSPFGSTSFLLSPDESTDDDEPSVPSRSVLLEPGTPTSAPESPRPDRSFRPVPGSSTSVRPSVRSRSLLRDTDVSTSAPVSPRPGCSFWPDPGRSTSVRPSVRSRSLLQDTDVSTSAPVSPRPGSSFWPDPGRSTSVRPSVRSRSLLRNTDVSTSAPVSPRPGRSFLPDPLRSTPVKSSIRSRSALPDSDASTSAPESPRPGCSFWPDPGRSTSFKPSVRSRSALPDTHMSTPDRSSIKSRSALPDPKRSMSVDAVSSCWDFPDNFQDFLFGLSATDDDDKHVLENKHLPPQQVEEPVSFHPRPAERQWTMNRRSLATRPTELDTKSPSRSEGKGYQKRPVYGRATATTTTTTTYSSPNIRRKRSSSVAARRSTEMTRYYSHGTRERLSSYSPELYGRSFSQSPARLRPHKLSMTGSQSSMYKTRTSSAPDVNPRKMPLAPRTQHFEDGVEYYRLRSFSITSSGVYNLGDSYKPVRSRSVTSVGSSESAQTTTDKSFASSAASQITTSVVEDEVLIPSYVVGVLGAEGVGKSSLCRQITASDYFMAFDFANDDDVDDHGVGKVGRKGVSVLLNGQEADLQIIDHPSSDESIEEFCSTHKPDICIVMYSIDDDSSFEAAEKMLMDAWKSDIMSTIGVILVGNKMDLERSRQVSASVGRRLSRECRCKFIEISTGLDHNVDELLVGIIAQIELNPKRKDYRTFKKKSHLKRGKKLLKRLLGLKQKTKSCENLFVL